MKNYVVLIPITSPSDEGAVRFFSCVKNALISENVLSEESVKLLTLSDLTRRLENEVREIIQ